jgi:ankyrin repeat protein
MTFFICTFCRTVNQQLATGATAAYLAAQQGHLEVVEYLVEEGGASVKLLAYDGMSCLHAAAQGGHTDIVKWLVTKIQI